MYLIIISKFQAGSLFLIGKLVENTVVPKIYYLVRIPTGVTNSNAFRVQEGNLNEVPI
jgi:hypothetical protein